MARLHDVVRTAQREPKELFSRRSRGNIVKILVGLLILLGLPLVGWIAHLIAPDAAAETFRWWQEHGFVSGVAILAVLLTSGAVLASTRVALSEKGERARKQVSEFERYLRDAGSSTDSAVVSPSLFNEYLPWAVMLRTTKEWHTTQSRAVEDATDIALLPNIECNGNLPDIVGRLDSTLRSILHPS